MKRRNTKIHRQTKNPRLLQERMRLINQSLANGFLLIEVAEIFRMTPANVSQQLKEKVDSITKK